MRRMALGAGAVGLVSALVPHGSEFRALPVVILSLLALVAGGVGLALRRPSREVTLALGMGLASVGITGANILSEASVAPYTAFYFWYFLYSCCLLSERSSCWNFFRF